ncbi:MAG: putative baseplate assembly protein [Cyanobacteria bacterium J06638_20]
MNEPCGCCKGTAILVPLPTANRPGLTALSYRVGTHATFLETMKARLSSSEFPALAPLKTRDTNDPAIALLDAWAIVADVLTFYQERIANEGYLRTATERRSILELSRLVGYVPRPGVAATVYPAFTLELGYNQDSIIPKGTRIQSVPGPGEMPQFFETAETIEARTNWNAIKPRLTRPHYITFSRATLAESDVANETWIKPLSHVYFDGITTNLKPNDPLLLVFGNQPGRQVFRQIKTLTVESVENRTRTVLQPLPSTTSPSPASPPGRVSDPPFRVLQDLRLPRSAFERLTHPAFNPEDKTILGQLQQTPSLPPANARQLGLTPRDRYSLGSDFAPKLLTALKPELATTLYTAWANAQIAEPPEFESVQALRVKAAPFGATAPLKPIYDEEGRIQGYEEWQLATTTLRVGVSFIAIQGTDPQEFPATIAINRDGVIQSRSIRLSTALPQQEMEVNGIPITIQLDVAVSPPLSFRFNFPEGEHIIRLGQETTIEFQSSAIRVEIDQDAWRISAGQTQRSTAWDGRQVVISAMGEPLSSITSVSISEDIPTRLPDPNVLALDALYDQITAGSWIVAQYPDQIRYAQVQQNRPVAKTAYGISNKVTQLTLDRPWIDNTSIQTLASIRSVTIYAQSEVLPLAEEVIDDPVEDGKTQELELGALYEGLEPGRWAIVSGERADLGAEAHVKASELVMLLGVRQDLARVSPPNWEVPLDLPGDKTHTFLQFAEPLKYQYKRDTVTIYGNVVKATHGETHAEVLGSGNGRQAFQQFLLRQAPLTYLAAPTAVGATSTLELRVNEVLWHEKDSLAGLKPSDRAYILKTDNDSKTHVIFGNGESGSRLPTGNENVRATYRSGIGKVGNVKAEQISLLATRPLGLKEVINPLPATGGANRERRDQARQNAPLALLALDRLVSVQDYADFARTFAGIGKANAQALSDGRRRIVHLTIAGVDNIPIAKSSDLYRNLSQALRKLGDPNLAIAVELRELMLLLISAKVKVLPDYQWELVEPNIRQALLEHFQFDRRNLGQDVTLSEVLRTIQQVPGVDYADLDILDTISEIEAANPALLVDKLEQLQRIVTLQEQGKKQGTQIRSPKRRSGSEHPQQPRVRLPVHLARPETDPDQRVLPEHLIQPAQLALLSADLPTTLILNPVEVRA